MSSSSIFGISEKALSVWSERGEVLSSNLANADTPGYQARDVDFKSALAQATGQTEAVQLEATQPDHLGSNVSSNDYLKYRVPNQPTMDGNTVDTQVEEAQFAENAVHYQASLSFLGEEIHMLKTAITGGQG